MPPWSRERARPELGRWHRPRAGLAGKGWLARRLCKSQSRGSRVRACASECAKGGAAPGTRGEAMAPGRCPGEARGAEGRGVAAVERAPRLLPALGAALGDFPSPGEKCVCVWDGARRGGRACAPPNLPDPGFFAPRLRSRPPARGDHGILLRGRAGSGGACKNPGRIAAWAASPPSQSTHTHPNPTPALASLPPAPLQGAWSTPGVPFPRSQAPRPAAGCKGPSGVYTLLLFTCPQHPTTTTNAPHCTPHPGASF